MEKYYIPELEDIRYGYQCKILNRLGNKPEEYTEYIIGEDYHEITLKRALREIEKGGIKVSYLTKEQIEQEDWRLLAENVLEDYYWGLFEKGKYRLKFWSQDSWIEIYEPGEGKEDDYLFQGISKSINELRTIQKLLDI